MSISEPFHGSFAGDKFITLTLIKSVNASCNIMHTVIQDVAPNAVSS